MTDPNFLTFDLTQPLHQVLFIIWIIGCWEFLRAYVAWVRAMWALDPRFNDPTPYQED